MVVCCASGCKNRTGSPRGITFHRLPKNEEMRARWIAAIRRKRWQPTRTTSICSQHFTEGDFDWSSLTYVRIRAGAVPSVFPAPRPRAGARNRKPAAAAAPTPPAAPPVAPPGRHPGTPPAPHLKSDHSYCKANSAGDAPTQAANSPSPRNSAPKRGPRPVVKTESERAANRKRRRIRRPDSAEPDSAEPDSAEPDSAEPDRAEPDGIVAELTKRRLVEEDSLWLLQSSLSRPIARLLARPAARTGARPPSPAEAAAASELRALALTLHLRWPRAYAHVRKTFSTRLPHPRVVSRWCRPAAGGGAGFTREALAALERKCELARAAGAAPLCALVAGETPLRPRVEWDGRRHRGRVDLGTGLDADGLPAARAALAFALVAVNAAWRLPVGYFLVDGLAGSERANLVRRCLSAAHDAGATVVSLTVEGTAADLATARALGCRLEPSERLETRFSHPVSGEPVFLFLDPCRMLTLARDALRERRSVADGGGGLVLWEHVERLRRPRVAEDRRPRGRLGAARLARFAGDEAGLVLPERLMSESLADVMDARCESKVPGFENSRPTATFIRRVNRLCDVLDSRNPLCEHGWKRPVSPENRAEIGEFLADVQNYIRTLKDSERGDRLVLSTRRTGFVGFLVCCQSVLGLYDHAASAHGLRSLCTYRLSWDHLGSFFDAVRSRAGGDKDPTARQFVSAYKRVLPATRDGARDEALDSAWTCRATRRGLRPVQLINASAERARVVARDSPGFNSPSSTTDRGFSRLPVPADDPEWSARAVACVARFVTRRLTAALKCERCAEALRGTGAGGNDDVLRICELSERLLRADRREGGAAPAPRWRRLLVLAAAALDRSRRRGFFAAHALHMFEQEPPGNHLVLLVQAVARSYLAVRFRQEAAAGRRAEAPAHALGLYAKRTLFYDCVG